MIIELLNSHGHPLAIPANRIAHVEPHTDNRRTAIILRDGGRIIVQNKIADVCAALDEAGIDIDPSEWN